MRCSLRSIALAALMCAACTRTTAAAAPTEAAPSKPTSRVYLQGGSVLGDADTGGLHRQSSMAMVSLGISRPMSPIVSLEAELFLAGADYDGPPVESENFLSAYGPKRSLGVVGLLVFCRWSASAGRFSPYVRRGIGFCSMDLSVSGVELLIVPSVQNESEAVGTVVGSVGLDVQFTDMVSLGVEARVMPLEASFGDLAPSRVSAGGPMLAVGLSRSLGRSTRTKR